MSAENINKLTEYAETLGFKFYDIVERVYNGRAETVLTAYLDKERTQKYIITIDWISNKTKGV